MEYEQLLQQAYASLPKKSRETIRLEIPTPESYVQGNQTVIRNFGQICTLIRREPEMVTRYLAKELATAGHVEGGRLVLNARIDSGTLAKKFDAFMHTYVLCRECGKPDTHIEDAGRAAKILRCEACGARSPITAKH